jgi:soluble lytic murein transglycosylase-like protein
MEPPRQGREGEMKNNYKPILAIVMLSIVLSLSWWNIWQLKAENRSLESDKATLQADLAEAKGDIEDMKDTPLEYLILYRRATIARFERIEPRWDSIMEANWRLSKKHGVSPDISLARMEHESFYNPDAIGPCGERGLMQVYPPAHPQFDISRGSEVEYGIDYGCRIFASCLKRANGDIKKALTLYNGTGTLPDGMRPYSERVLNSRVMKIK